MADSPPAAPKKDQHKGDTLRRQHKEKKSKGGTLRRNKPEDPPAAASAAPAAVDAASSSSSVQTAASAASTGTSATTLTKAPTLAADSAAAISASPSTTSVQGAAGGTPSSSEDKPAPPKKEDKRLRKLPKIDVHRLTLAELEKRYNTSIVKGLSEKERTKRRRQDGPNLPRQAFETREQKHNLDYDRLVDAIDSVSVVIDGELQRVERSSLVRGDIVVLAAGDLVPADVRIIKAANLEAIHTNLTAKDEPVRRSAVMTDDNPLETENLLWCRTWLARGSAVGLVWATGTNTVLHTWTEGAETTCWCQFTPKIEEVVSRLMRRNFFVKRPDCLEQVGKCDVLLADVSLFLEEKAKVSNVYIDEEIFGMDEVEEMLAGKASPEPLLSLEQLQIAAGLCNNAEFHRRWRDIAAPGQELDPALAQLCSTLEDLTRIRAQHPLIYSCTWFTIHQEADTNVCWMWKRGLADDILKTCTSGIKNGREEPLSPAGLDSALQAAEDIAGGGEFVVAYARLRLPASFTPTFDYEHNHSLLPREGFTFCGLVSVVRQLQKDVLKSLNACKDMSLMPVLVSSAHPASIKAIATALRLPVQEVVDPTPFIAAQQDRKTWRAANAERDEFWARVVKGEVAFSGITTVHHKMAIVKGIQEKASKTVLVVANAVDDGWELRGADVCVAPGRSSYPAKVTADVLYADDNISTLVAGLADARTCGVTMADIQIMESTMEVNIDKDSKFKTMFRRKK